MQVPRQDDRKDENGEIGYDTDKGVGEDDCRPVQTHPVAMIDIPVEVDWAASENFDKQDDSVIRGDEAQETVQGDHLSTVETPEADHGIY